jgi:hypothetical protein
LLLLCVGLLLEGLALLKPGLLWLHPLASLTFSLGFAGRFENPERARGWVLVSLVLTMFVPGVAFLGMLSLLQVARRLAPPSPLEEMQAFTRFESPFVEVAYLTRPEQLRQALRHPGCLGGELSLNVGGIRAVLERSRLSSPELVEKLRRYLVNPRSDAYLLARSELGRLREDFAVSIAVATERARSAPSSPEAHLSLALLYEDYLKSGLVEESVQPHYVELTSQRWSELARLEPDNPNWQLARARISMSHGLITPALEASRELLERWPDDPDIKVLLLEVLYEGARRGALEAVQAFLAWLARLRAELQLSGVRDPRLRELAAYWLGAN